MSGVVAVLHRSWRPADGSAAEAMLAAAAHRAVHGHTLWRRGPVALGHQRFDSWAAGRSGAQPLVDDEAGLAISCDTRLDRRDELAAVLGHGAAAEVSDARLILSAYRRWGADCLEHLRGDFAFALWDERGRRLLCGRDALGVRDLSYHVDAEVCVVASEIVQVVAHPRVPRRLHAGRVVEYLAGYWHNQVETAYEGVLHLPPGHGLEVTEGSHRVWRHWHPSPEPTQRLSDDEAAERLRDALTTAVRGRLPVDDDAAVSLSGGPDSAVLAALLAADGGPSGARSFSYVFDRLSSCDERDLIGASVAAHGLEATLVPGDDRWPLRWPDRWPVFHDLPSQDPFVWLPLSLADAAAEQGIRVLLNGHYSDLLFAGGASWAADLLRSGRIAQLVRLALVPDGGVRPLRDLVRNGLWALRPGWAGSVAAALRPRVEPRSWEMLTPEAKRTTDLADRVAAPTPPPGWTVDRFHRLRHLTMAVGPVGASLVRSLYNSRGLELVDPYWDRELVELVLALPADQLCRPPFTKWLLRRAMVGRVPERVLWRRDRTSLIELFEVGLLDHERGTVQELLKDARIVDRGWVRRGWLEEQLAAGRGWSDHGYPLWRCLTLELWLRRWWSGEPS